MNIKYINIKSITLLLTGLMVLNSCKEEFLEIEPIGRNLEDNYYRNEEESFNGLIAAYDAVNWVGGFNTKIGVSNAADDDHHAGGGGGSDMETLQVLNHFTLDPARGPQGDLWAKGFSGIFRSNILLSKLPDAEMDESVKARFTAETKFLRAFYYFDLIRFFKSIPLITEPISAAEMYNVLQVERSLVFAQIEKDLLEAIPSLPPTVSGAELGRATQGAARALLGKVYLQQDKFGPAAEQLKEVNGTPGGVSQYGYKLLDNYADLWNIDNKYNSESIFEIGHTSKSNGSWDCSGCTEGNVYNVNVGPRGYTIVDQNAGAPQYASGWSFNTITPSLVDAFTSGGVYDPRYKSTVANIDSLEKAGVVTYIKGGDNTGYFIAKFAPKSKDVSTGGGNWELNYRQNIYEIRLADTYLMEAEALVRGGGDQGRAQLLLDAVRGRVGLGSVSATFENIFNERRLELASEGHRWFDLVRTGKAASALSDMGFKEGKNEFLPIPLLELNNTALIQDPAYQ